MTRLQMMAGTKLAIQPGNRNAALGSLGLLRGEVMTADRQAIVDPQGGRLMGA